MKEQVFEGSEMTEQEEQEFGAFIIEMLLGRGRLITTEEQIARGWDLYRTKLPGSIEDHRSTFTEAERDFIGKLVMKYLTDPQHEANDEFIAEDIQAKLDLRAEISVD